MAEKDWKAKRKAQKELEAAQAKEAAWNKQQEVHEARMAEWRSRARADRKQTFAQFLKIKEAEEAQAQELEKQKAQREKISTEQRKHVDLAQQLGKIVKGNNQSAAELIGLNKTSLALREQDNQELLALLQNGKDGVTMSEEDKVALEEKVKANNALSEIQAQVLQDMSTGTLTQQDEQDILNQLKEKGVDTDKLTAKELDNIMAEVKGISKGTATLADEGMAELLELADQTDGALEKWQGKVKMFGAALKNPALAITALKVSALGLAASFAKDIFDGALKFKQELGLSAGEAAKLSLNVEAASKYTKFMGGDASLIAASASEMVKEFGSTSVFTAAIAKDMAGLAISTGFGGAEAAKLLKTMEGVSGASIETNINTLEAWGNLAKAEGVSQKLVLDDVAKSTDDFARFAKDGGDNIIKAAIAASKLGLELSDVAKISDSLLNIEDSLTKEMEAEMLIGKQLNLDKARELALAGDLEGVMNEVKNIGISQAEWSEMNVIQRQALADSIGVSVADMGKLLAGDKTSAMVAKDAADEKEKADKAALLTQESMMGLMVAMQGISAGILVIEKARGAAAAIIKAREAAGLSVKAAQFGLGLGTATAALTATIVGIPLIAGLLALAYGAVSKGKSLATAEEGGVVTGTGMAEIHEGEVFSGTKNEMGFGGTNMTETNRLLEQSLAQSKVTDMTETNKLLKQSLTEFKQLREQNELLTNKLIRTTGDLQLANA